MAMKRFLLILILVLPLFAQEPYLDVNKATLGRLGITKPAVVVVGGLITLTANSDTVLIGGYLPIGTAADTANTTGTQEIFMSYSRARFMYAGNVQKVSFYIKDASVIDTFRIRIWRGVASPDMSADRSFSVVQTSADLSSQLVDGVNNITLATPLAVREGDMYSLQYVASDSGIAEPLTSANISAADTCKVSTSLITDTVGFRWDLETSIARHFPIKFYSSPAPVMVIWGHSMVDGNPYWQSGVSTWPLSFAAMILRLSIGYRMAQYTGWTVVNMGIGGQTSAQTLARWADVLAENPAFVWIEAGGNDNSGTAELIANNLKAMVDSCVVNNIPFGLNKIPSYNERTLAIWKRWDTVNTEMEAYTSSQGGIWCDMRQFMSMECDSVGATPGNDWLLDPHYGADIVHYNDTGKSVWLWKLLTAMRAVYTIPNDTMAVYVDNPSFGWDNTTASVRIYDQFTLDSAHVNITRTSTGTSWYAAFSTLTSNNAYTKVYSFDFQPYIDSIYDSDDILTYTISGYGKSGNETYSGSFQNWGYGLVPELTTDSSAAPIRIYAITQAEGFEKWKAFDNDITNAADCWAVAQNTGWIMVDFGQDTTVSFYSIIGRGQGLNFDFKDWVLYGSADSLTWTAVDTQTDVAVWTTLEHRTYTLSSPATYRYWKWDVTENQGGAATEAVQIQLYGY